MCNMDGMAVVPAMGLRGLALLRHTAAESGCGGVYLPLLKFFSSTIAAIVTARRMGYRWGTSP